MTERAMRNDHDVDRHRQASLIAGALFVGSLVLLIAVMLTQVPRSFFSAKATVALVHEASARKSVGRGAAARPAIRREPGSVSCGDGDSVRLGAAPSIKAEAGPSR